MPIDDTTDPERERWLPVPGWPDYEVSDLGRVRSFRCASSPGRIMKTGGSAYPQVNLQRGDRGCYERKLFRVHELVLRAFVGPPRPGMECRHLDDQKSNNRLSNLRWGTRSQNLGEDRRRNGLLTIGTKHGMSKLNDQAVLVIRHCCAAMGYGTGALLARLYGISHATVMDVAKGRYWNHIGGPITCDDGRSVREK